MSSLSFVGGENGTGNVRAGNQPPVRGAGLESVLSARGSFGLTSSQSKSIVPCLTAHLSWLMPRSNWAEPSFISTQDLPAIFNGKARPLMDNCASAEADSARTRSVTSHSVGVSLLIL